MAVRVEGDGGGCRGWRVWVECQGGAEAATMCSVIEAAIVRMRHLHDVATHLRCYRLEDL